VLCAALSLVTLCGPPSAGAEWVTTGSPVGSYFAGLLVSQADGTVFLIGTPGGGASPAVVEQYHPATGAWTVDGTLQQLSRPGAATALSSGLILLTGGGLGATTSAELYDPASGVSTVTGSLNFARTSHQATLLPTGKVLVSGGTDANGNLVPVAELYDPATGTWSVTGALNNARTRHTAVRLPNGDVLVAGGSGPNGTLASAEIYDVDAGSWFAATAMDRPRDSMSGTALPDGPILVAGSADDNSLSSQLYDPATNTWAPGVAIPSSCVSGCFIPPRALVALQNGVPLAVELRCAGILGGCFLDRPLTFDTQGAVWNPTEGLVPFSSGSPGLAALPDGRALLFATTGPSAPPTPAQLFRPDNSTAQLVVSPPALDFGTSDPGTPVQQALTLQNTGGATLTGTLTAPAGFTVVSGSPFTLAPGASTTAVVRFSPPGFGTFSGSVQVRSNGNWVSVEVTGVGGVRLSGRVTDALGGGIGIVTVDLGGATTGTTLTDATGQYEFFVAPNNGYTLTPANPALAFIPTSRSVLVTTASIGELNFTAQAVGDDVARFVTDLYGHVLGHAPDPPAGFVGWTGFLRQHCHVEGLRVVTHGFFDSEELRTKRPLTLAGLVTALYRAVLGRDPEPGGLSGWTGVFRQARLSLATEGFIPSAEFQGILPDRTNRQAVTAVLTRFYTEILGRAPEPFGLTLWVDYVVSTGDLEGAAVNFLVSPEFEARPLTFRDYVTILYRTFLGRPPEPTGLDGWESLLRGQLLQTLDGGFIASAEFQARIPRLCPS
jgi:hypothetical protein